MKLRVLLRLGCGLAISAIAHAEDGIPAPTVTLFSGTVAHPLSRVAAGPSTLVTTYYQIEGAWPFTSQFALKFEVEGGQVIGNNHAESLSLSLGSAYRLNDLQEDPELFVPNLFLSGRVAGGAIRWKAGRLGLQSLFDDNRVARAKRTKFLSLPFTRNAAIAFPGKGLGAELGWAVSADAELAPATVAFLRLGSGSEHFARVRGFVAGGLAWEKPLGRKMDFAGLGLSRGMVVNGRRTEIVAEIVYRYQATPWLALSPDVQWIRHPAFSLVNDAWAAGLRVALARSR